MLEFRGREAIKFGDLAVFPQDTPELRLRIRKVNFNTDTDTQEAIEVMSSFFPEHKDEVKRFLQEQMKDYELAMLQTYLVGGSSAVGMVERSIERDMERRVKESREATNG